MMPPFVVFPTNRIAHFVEVSLYLFYLAQQVKLKSFISISSSRTGPKYFIIIFCISLFTFTTFFEFFTTAAWARRIYTCFGHMSNSILS